MLTAIAAKAQPPTFDSVRTPLNVNFTGCDCDTGAALNGLRSELASILPATKYRRMTPACKIVFFEPDNRVHHIYGVNENLPVMPASVQKLFTTSTTLWALGPDYNFETRLDVLPSARRENGSLIGNVYLRPSGDPTLGVADFDLLADSLKAMGITQIEGDIVSDLSRDHILTPDAKHYFDEHLEVAANDAGGGDSKDELDPAMIDDQASSNAEDHADDEAESEGDSPGFLSTSPNFFIDRNVITVHVVAGSKKGDRVHVSVTPPLANIRVINHAGTSAPSSTTYKRVKIGKGRHAKYKTVKVRKRSTYTLHFSSSGGATDDAQTVVISGLIPAHSSRRYNVPIHNVPEAMAGLLKWRLEEHGIRVTGTATSGEPPLGVETYRTLTEKQTPLLDLLQVTNKRSDNFLAESMFRKLSAVADVPAADPAERSRTLIHSWMDVINVNCVNGYCADGSGLSHDNHTTATTVIDLLRGIRCRPKMFDNFVSTLSIAGFDGTTRARMLGTPAQYNARSKTGTLNAVTALAGFVSTQDGQLAAYFITMQDLHGGVKRYRSVQNKIVEKLAAFKYADYVSKYAPQTETAPRSFTAPDVSKSSKIH